jgi:hypothetical protein
MSSLQAEGEKVSPTVVRIAPLPAGSMINTRVWYFCRQGKGKKTRLNIEDKNAKSPSFRMGSSLN